MDPKPVGPVCDGCTATGPSIVYTSNVVGPRWSWDDIVRRPSESVEYVCRARNPDYLRFNWIARFDDNYYCRPLVVSRSRVAVTMASLISGAINSAAWTGAGLIPVFVVTLAYVRYSMYDPESRVTDVQEVSDEIETVDFFSTSPSLSSGK